MPATLPIRLPAQNGLYQSVLVRALESLREGALRMRFPDGTDIIYGEDGAGSAAEIQVRNSVFFKKCVMFGDVGLGESYVDGDWDTPDIAAVISWFILNLEHCPTVSGSAGPSGVINALGWVNKLLHRFRGNNLKGSRSNIHAHYDLGNDFFRLFLDPGMTYSCAYFQSAHQSLEEAQTAKNDVLCKKMRLKPSDHLLEIGCGWGGFALHAARNYGCRVTAITISGEQFEYASRRIRNEGLAGKIAVYRMDYRQLSGQFDKIVSVEMLEAVGDKYLETYFSKCHELLKRNGLLGLQMITCPDSRRESFRRNVDWIQKHIFPGSLLLSVGRVNEALNRTGDLFLHDLEDMGRFYVRTLMKWQEAYNKNLDAVRSQGFDEKFIRKWNYYLSYCRAAFQSCNISAVQAVYTRPNNRLLVD